MLSNNINLLLSDSKSYVTDGLQVYLDAKNHGNINTTWEGLTPKQSYTYYNISKDPDITSTGNWIALASTLTFPGDGTVILTANGGAFYSGMYTSFSKNAPVIGDKVYTRIKFKVLSSDCLYVRVYRGNAYTTLLNNPIIDTWYDIGTVTTENGSAYQFVEIEFGYASGPIANGKQVQVDRVMAVNLTKDFGAGNEPLDSNWCDANMPFTSTSNPVSKGTDGLLNKFTFDSASGWNNNELVFDGVNDYVTLNTGLSGLTDFTLEFKVMIPSDAPSWKDLFTFSSNGERIETGSGNNIDWFGNNAIMQNSSVLCDVTRNVSTVLTIAASVSNGVKVYINGNLVKSLAHTGTPFPISTTSILGARTTDTTGLKTNISYFRVYNRALTNTEVTQNYNYAMTPVLTTLKVNNGIKLTWT